MSLPTLVERTITNAEVYRLRKLGDAKFYINIYHLHQYMVMCYHGNSQSQSSALEAKYSWQLWLVCYKVFFILFEVQLGSCDFQQGAMWDNKPQLIG